MPSKPLHGCNAPRCPNLTSGRYCSAHPKAELPKIEENRPSAAKRGYDGKWREASQGFLAKHPLCAIRGPRCKLGASLVDHIEPHRGDREKFWSRANWQSACAPCHSEKTAREDGGFGNRRRNSA